MNQCAYIFLDESGNFDFSAKGSRYFLLTSVSMKRPFLATRTMDDYKHDCLEYGLNLEYFHCYRDGRDVRRRVFDLIARYLDGMCIDCLVIEKARTDTVLREDRRFYPKLLLHSVLPPGIKYHILHHQSRSHYGLQVADYCCWAIFRKWQTGENAWYDHIKPAVRNELELFRDRS
ncbi:MAG: DUF3800 domain-containing protein [Gemmatimonadota bacterium]|nr:DUF3800 domain-containing protein [Gemmatimonadota bacterium]